MDKDVTVHRLTDSERDRMITMNGELSLTGGPSNEEMFDCLRLGSSVKELKVIEFWGEKRETEPIPSRSGASLRIEIDGIHKASTDGRLWFFWGRLKQINSGENWVPDWEAKNVCFVFGKWNTHRRYGKITFGETSFFNDPFPPQV